MPGHLKVKTPGDPVTPPVSDRGNHVKISKCSSSSNLKHELCTLLQTAYRNPRRAGREWTLGFEFSSIKKTCQKHQELTQTVYPLSNQAPSPAIPHHVIVEELNLRHLHSNVSQGGCHWECCVFRFFQNEPCTVSNRTHTWPLSSTSSVRSQAAGVHELVSATTPAVTCR